MSKQLWMADLATTGEYCYRATLTESNIRAEIALRNIGTTKAPEYELSRHYGRLSTTRGKMGTKQRTLGQQLLIELTPQFMAELTRAGWTSRTNRFGRDVWVRI